MIIKNKFRELKRCFGEKALGRLGFLDGYAQGLLTGWAGYRESATTGTRLHVYINKTRVLEFTTDASRSDIVALGYPAHNRLGFSFPLCIYPFLDLHSDSHVLSVRHAETGRELQGSPLVIPPPDIHAKIERIDDQAIHGWVYDRNYPEVDMELDVYRDGEHVATIPVDLARQDVVDSGGPKIHCGFRFYFSDTLGPAETASFEFFIAGTRIRPFSDPACVFPFGAKLASLAELAKLTRQLYNRDRSDASRWLSMTLLPHLINEARQTRGANLPALPGAAPAPLARDSQTVDVIIPVYDGYEETLNCLRSVAEAKVETPHTVIVINDQSPNPRLTRALRRLSSRYGYRLIENETNLGFVGTVNKGMRLNPSHDVVLLNADTLVPDRWLDQLHHAALSNPSIGTVTPFSNNATVYSYPNPCQDNEISPELTVNDLNRAFYQANHGCTVDIPSGHGFCFYIKRQLLDEIGLFDDEKWGKGYAEENDFSLRAAIRGWRNVLAPDTFVQHLGSVSFAESAQQFIAKNLETLNSLYPEYAASVEQFIRDDPLRPYRNRAAMEQLQQEVAACQGSPLLPSGKTVLFVSLTLGGGTQVATDEMARRLGEDGICVLMLSASSKGRWQLRSHTTNAIIEFRWPEEQSLLIQALEQLEVGHLHYHHTLQFPPAVWSLPDQLGIPYDVTLHDYHAICPRVNLIDDTRRYCGEPSVAACDRCIHHNGLPTHSYLTVHDLDGGVSAWRDAFHDRLHSARAVFVPSQDVATRMARYFPDIPYHVRPHPESPRQVTSPAVSGDETLHVVCLGAIGYHKGYEPLLGCARHALKFDLPIHFHVIGYTLDDAPLKALPNVTISGRYSPAELPSLINATGARVAALLSVWPETFSYTLSEALRLGLKPVIFDMGAPAERLPDKAGTRIHPDASVADICEHLLATRHLPDTTYSVGCDYPSVLIDYYGLGAKGLTEQKLLSSDAKVITTSAV